MFCVDFSETGRRATVAPGATILDAARLAGLDLESPCNRTGVCGKCRVMISPASLENVIAPEHHAVSPAERAEGWCLACHAEVAGNIEVVRVPAMARDSGPVLREGKGATLPLVPFIAKRYASDRDRTLVFACLQEVGSEAGDTSRALYGAAVDIGTTTLVVSLVDLNSGRELASVTAHNPQARYAQDVLSRIAFAGTAEGLATMQRCLVARLNEMLAELAGKAGIVVAQIYELVFSGNTCMLHLATGHSPKSLGRYPYTPLIRGHESFSAAMLGLAISPFAQVYLPPILSPFVGADITSGILSLQLHRQEGVFLLVDIGTNGEIVLADHGRLIATSTAAGPALEGMNIGCGMCAGPGAVERVGHDGAGGITYRTIGDTLPLGLCGSGLIDLVATLLALGVIGANGRFAAPEALPQALEARMRRENGATTFMLSEDVRLSQKDIRQVQLAKGAIQAGIVALLRHTGIGSDHIDRVLIAGAFGYHLATESLIRLRILPHEWAGKIEYVGNTSKTGGQAFLTNAPSREDMGSLAAGVEIVELAGRPDFERLFVDCLSF